jgi:hypothetical protein
MNVTRAESQDRDDIDSVSGRNDQTFDFTPEQQNHQQLN